MNVLGINIAKTAEGKQVYDGAACLIVDGIVHSAIAEERLTRIKHCGGFNNATRFLLDRASLDIKEIDLVVTSCYGEEPRLDLFRDLGLSKARRVEMIPSHHLSHAFTAFLPSGFTKALILVADNEGSIIGNRKHKETWKNALERVSIYHGHGKAIELLERDMAEEDMVSLGELYSIVTHYVGFNSYQNAGKTMALAAFGDPSRFRNVPMIKFLPQGKLICPLRNQYYNSIEELRRFFKEYGHDLPPERNPESILIPQVYQDLAAAAQEQLEEALLHKVHYWVERTGTKYVGLAGGVALNCLANRRLLDEVPLERIYIHPNAGDQGQALGNALFGWCEVLGRREIPQMETIYLGGEYGIQRCIEALEKWHNELTWHESSDVVGETADLLARSAVVGWFQGRSEWGPRALGGRSILADPRRIEMKDHINRKVKHREPFRPFAPVVTIEEAPRYFDIKLPSPYMTIVAPIQPEAVEMIPAVAHVDLTARLQTVSKEENPRLHLLLKRFGELTGVQILLNTSFNDQGEPIVETPEDAINCFMRTDIDILILGDLVVLRKGT